MKNLTNKHILLGITGGIGAYKSAELTRRLCDAGAEVRIVMTASAKEFITPLTLQALSGFPVRDSLWDEEAEKAMSHIELAKWADLILIAPATADCIAKLAYGLADDLLATVCLASIAPLFLAPAMNQAMWHHKATQSNVDVLKTRGTLFLGPASGAQACGDTGLGRMLEPMDIVENIITYFFPFSQNLFLQEHSLLITAGPTQEAIDPVRYITNHSSGKMGYALAEAAYKAGAKVTLVSGPTQLVCSEGIKRIDIKSAQDMYDAVMNNVADASIFIGAAAVGDYRIANIETKKIKKKENYTLELIKNPDILAQVASLPEKPFIVGFAAETDNVLEYAKQKLISKNLDMIIANPVNNNQGFYSDQNQGWILTAAETIPLSLMSKSLMAEKILQTIKYLYSA